MIGRCNFTAAISALWIITLPCTLDDVPVVLAHAISGFRLLSRCCQHNTQISPANVESLRQFVSPGFLSDSNIAKSNHFFSSDTTAARPIHAAAIGPCCKCIHALPEPLPCYRTQPKNFSPAGAFQPRSLCKLEYAHPLAKYGQKFGINLARHGGNRNRLRTTVWGSGWRFPGL